MKEETDEYLAHCLECQQLNIEHQHLLHPFPIPKWKWDIITLYFIIGLPMSKRKNDYIMVVVDKLGKVSHFLLIQSTYKVVPITDIFMKEIFRLYWIPKMVISNRDVKFTYIFLKALFTGLGTQIQFNTIIHKWKGK